MACECVRKLIFCRPSQHSNIYLSRVKISSLYAAIAALKGPFVGQRGAQYQIFKWPPDYLYIVLVLVGVE